MRSVGSRLRAEYLVRDDTEMEPMLGESSRLSSVQSRIEMDEGIRKTQPLMELIRRRFTCVYLILGFVLLVALAVLVVAMMLLFHMKSTASKYDNITKLTGSEGFMRLYEDFTQAKGTHRKPTPTNELAQKLTPEQLAMARAYGLLPQETKTDDLGQPIKPVVGTAKSTPPPPVAMSLDDDPSTIFKQDKDFYEHSWHDPSCEIQCNKSDVTIPPLLIISLDAFAAQYLSRKLVPSLDTMAKCGARAEHMYPCFPSKTFPNHYSIATGLYPESHGIVDNSVFDRDISPVEEDMKRTRFSAFYGGEPIWSAAVRQRRRMFCLFWPGCSFNITGHNPTLDLKYNKSMTYSARVDTIADWLARPADHRPDLVMAYFDQPDTVGHFHKTEREVNLELSYLETVLNYLFTSLDRNGMLDCVNIVILSDHGMQQLDKRYYVNEMLDSEGMIVANGVVGRIYMNASKSTADEVVDKLDCSDDHFHVYDRDHTPARYHYTRTHRIGDVILEGKPGAIFFPTKESDYHIVGDHGYDYTQPNMHAIFFARGPNIRPQTHLDPFQNVELFNLFTELLRLNKDVPNNGTDGLLEEVVYNIQPLKTTMPYTECDHLPNHEHRELKACSENESCKQAATQVNLQLNDCPAQTPSIAGTFYTDRSSLCFVNHCTASTVVDSSQAFGAPTLVYEALTAQDFEVVEETATSEELCGLNDVRYEPECKNWTGLIKQGHSKSLNWTSILSTRGNDIYHYNHLYFLMYKEFREGPFAFLQNLTKSYAQKFEKVVSVTAAVYDFNRDGVADSPAQFWSYMSSLPKSLSEHRRPSHIVRVLFRCEGNQWHVSGQSCRRTQLTRVIAFILPNTEKQLNCLEPREYLKINMARVKDVELLAQVQFFHERMWYAERDSLRWRTNITTELW